MKSTLIGPSTNNHITVHVETMWSQKVALVAAKFVFSSRSSQRTRYEGEDPFVDHLEEREHHRPVLVPAELLQEVVDQLPQEHAEHEDDAQRGERRLVRRRRGLEPGVRAGPV